MGALPTPQPAFRYTRDIEELRCFFADNHLYFGISTDILPLVERLHESPDFREQMTEMVQSILAREGRSIHGAELLEIVANAIGGPLGYKSSPELSEPLSQLYDFLAAVPYPDGLGKSGEIISFPATGLEREPVDGETEPERETRIGPVRGLGAATDSSEAQALHGRRRSSLQGPSFRKLLMAAGIGVLVAVILAIVLRPRSPVVRPAVVHGSGASTVVHPPKPSAYGEAFTPTPTPARHHSRRKPSTDATGPSGGGSNTQPANADH